MSWVTILWSMIASACLTLAAIYGLVWYRTRAGWAQLLLALRGPRAHAAKLRENEARMRLAVEAELAVRSLSGRLLSAQEEERRRIARELHDHVSQRMAMVSIGIGQIARRLESAPATAPRALRDLGRLIVEISTDIHNLSHRLHSTKLETLGLTEALRGHCQELLSQGVDARFDHENVPRSLPIDVTLCLFRVGQEALANVIKHSGAREAHVTLRATAGHVLVLGIRDCGRGFDQDGAVVERMGLGLASMRERLRLLDGEFSVRSRPGQGTTIVARVRIPALDSPPAADTVNLAGQVPGLADGSSVSGCAAT